MNSKIITTLIYTLALIVTLSLISGSVQSAGFDDPHQTSGVYSPDDKTHAQGEPQETPLEDYAFYTISHPGASSTTLYDINDAGEIVGTYRHPDFSGTRGFLFSEGSFVQIHVPGSDDTHAYGINDAGEIVGTYSLSGMQRGFLYREGSFITIHYPNAAWTLARGINNAGQIVGWFWEGGTYHGYYSFVVSDGILRRIENPGACNLFAWDINDAGEITGDYYNWDQNRYYGFVLKDGALDLFLIPGSTHTEARGINNDGQIVGAWPAYLYSDGEFGIWSLGDVFYGINDAGVLVGRGGGYSWVATPAINLGQVTLAYGDVSISGNPVNAGTSVRNGDSLSVGEDGFLVFTLSAESGERAIWVDANSELSVAGESTSSESTIEFWKGRIRAIIRDLPEGYSLEMRMEGTALAVRGTEFIIEGDDTSYVVTVLEGLVEVSTTDGAQSVFVNEDHEVEVTPEGLGEPYPIDPNDVDRWWDAFIIAYPEKVILLSPENETVIGTDTVKLSWLSGVPDILYYELEIATDADFENIHYSQIEITDTFYVFTSLEDETDYWWRVRAHNEAGAGEYSDEYMFKVLIDAIETPSIFVIKTADPAPYYTVGDTITYSISVTNTGSFALSNISVTDSLLGLNETINKMYPGDSITFAAIYPVTHNDFVNCHIENTAFATAYYNDIVVESKDTVVIYAICPSLSIFKTADKDAFTHLEEELSYSILIRNDGSIDLSDINISDPLTGLSETIPSLPPGQEETLITSYIITQSDIDRGVVENTATATVTYQQQNFVASDTFTTFFLAQPSLSMNKTADPSTYQYAGEVVVYTIELTNSGNVPLSDILVEDPLTGLKRTLDKMDSGEVRTFVETYTINQVDINNGFINNTATAESSYEGTPVNAMKSRTITAIQNASLLLEKHANPDVFSTEGQEITFYLTVINDGNLTLSSIVVEDPMLDIEEVLPVIQPGESETISGSYQITKEDFDAGKVTNNAEALGIDRNGNEVSASITAEVHFSPVSVGPEPFRDVSVYPSPFGDEITITPIEGVRQVVITNLLGIPVMSIYPKGQQTIDTRHLPRGMYIISLEGYFGERTAFRLLKQ